jgi:chromosome segregation ATPase
MPSGSTFGASAAATTTPSQASELVLDYQNMTVEQILNAFQKHLEADAAAFIQESQRVLDADAALRQAQSDLVHLTTHAQKLCVQQQDLQGQVAAIESQQDALDGQLGLVEEMLDGLFKSQSHLSPGDADVQREKSYAAAAAIDRKLNALSEQLRGSLKALDEASSSSGGGAATDDDEGSRELVSLLNQHQNALAEIELTTHRVERDMKRVAHALSASSSSGGSAY